MHISWWPISLKRVEGSAAPEKMKIASDSRTACNARRGMLFKIVIMDLPYVAPAGQPEAVPTRSVNLLRPGLRVPSFLGLGPLPVRGRFLPGPIPCR